MSVDRTDYLILGYMMPYNLKTRKDEEIDLWDDKYLPYLEGWKDEKYRLIRDGMGGQYNVFGLVLNQSDDYGGFDFIEIEHPSDPGEYYLHQKALELFPDVDFDFSEPKLILFSHYS